MARVSGTTVRTSVTFSGKSNFLKKERRASRNYVKRETCTYPDPVCGEVKWSEVSAASPAWTACSGMHQCTGAPLDFHAQFLLPDGSCWWLQSSKSNVLRWTWTFNIENELGASLRLSTGLTRWEEMNNYAFCLSDCVVCVSVWIISSPSSAFEQRRKLTITPESLLSPPVCLCACCDLTCACACACTFSLYVYLWNTMPRWGLISHTSSPSSLFHALPLWWCHSSPTKVRGDKCVWDW